MTHGERINIKREIREEQERQKTGWGEAGQCQEAREDRTVARAEIHRVEKRGEGQGGCLGLSALSQSSVSREGGVQLGELAVGGKQHLMPSWPERPS